MPATTAESITSTYSERLPRRAPRYGGGAAATRAAARQELSAPRQEVRDIVSPIEPIAPHLGPQFPLYPPLELPSVFSAPFQYSFLSWVREHVHNIRSAS